MVLNDKHLNSSCQNANTSLTFLDENQMFNIVSCAHEKKEANLVLVVEVLPNQTDCEAVCKNITNCRRFFGIYQKSYITHCNTHFSVRFDLCMINKKENM